MKVHKHKEDIKGIPESISSPISSPFKVPLDRRQKSVNSYGTGGIAKIVFTKIDNGIWQHTVEWTIKGIDEGLLIELINAIKGYAAQAPPAFVLQFPVLSSLPFKYLYIPFITSSPIENEAQAPLRLDLCYGDIPGFYNETGIFLLSQGNISNAYCFWDFSLEDKNRIARHKAVIRIYDVTGQGAFNGYNHNSYHEYDITFNENQEHWLTALGPGREYISQSGYYDLNGQYQSVAISNRIMTARNWEIKTQPYFGTTECGYTPDPTLKHYRYLHDNRFHSHEEKANLAIVLHHHLPFARHLEYPNFLEERWYFEAVVDTYTRGIANFEGWLRDGVDFRMTISLTPSPYRYDERFAFTGTDIKAYR